MYDNSNSFILQVLSTYIFVPFLSFSKWRAFSTKIFKLCNGEEERTLMKALTMIFRFIIILRLETNLYQGELFQNFSFQW